MGLVANAEVWTLLKVQQGCYNEDLLGKIENKSRRLRLQITSDITNSDTKETVAVFDWCVTCETFFMNMVFMNFEVLTKYILT